MKMQASVTRYSDEELKEFGELIDSKLIEAKNQLDFYTKSLSEFGENEEARVRGLDNCTMSVEQERMMTLAARQRKLIHHLENARTRVDNKVYGVCRESGKLIAKKRLMAVPHATLSIDAKQKG